tara:strand:+ start:390 stop:653 length:264 start_codon:yes stop_codon:yes gene_type:complete
MDKNNIVTVYDLQKMKDQIINELALITNQTTTHKEWLRSSEVMEMLSISTGTLQNLRINGTISYTRMGGTLFYKRVDIIAALNKNTA